MLIMDPTQKPIHTRLPFYVFEIEEKAKTPTPIVQEAAPEPSDKCGFVSKSVVVVKQAHLDRFVGVMKLSEEIFVTASLRSIKTWDISGKCLQTVEDESSHGNWGKNTVLRRLNDKKWASGTNKGRVSVWDVSGKKVQEKRVLKYSSAKPHGNHIFSLAGYAPDSRKTFCLVGHLSSFSLYDLTSKKMVSTALDSHVTTQAKLPVTAMECIRDNSWLIVTGDRLKVMQKRQDVWKWNVVHTLIPGGSLMEVLPFHYITSLHHLRGKKNKDKMMGVTSNKIYRIIDMTSHKTVSTYKEHRGFILSGTSLLNEVAGTTDSEGYVKIWDIRMEKSAMTMHVDPSPVNKIRKVKFPYFITGSEVECPATRRKEGQMNIWDLRKTS